MRTCFLKILYILCMATAMLQANPLKIQKLSLHPYEIPLTTGQMRSGVFLQIFDENGNGAWGEIAPLPKWSKETLPEALIQLNQKQDEILAANWTKETCLQELERLELLPSVTFGLESALLSLLDPLAEHQVSTSALLMGSPHEILQQAKQRLQEGFISAKLKVSNLRFEEAAQVIHALKDQLRLRIDVNRAWNTEDSLRFFAQFPLDTFDYVEEPFSNPHDLAQFLHPLAVDESYPHDLSLEEMESFPTLKALIYKPTMQGGMLGCMHLKQWAEKRGVEIVLSSSFESDLGLGYVASVAHRLSLPAPVGIGTFHYLEKHLCSPPLQFSNAVITIPSQLNLR